MVAPADDSSPAASDDQGLAVEATTNGFQLGALRCFWR